MEITKNTFVGFGWMRIVFFVIFDSEPNAQQIVIRRFHFLIKERFESVFITIHYYKL